MIYANTNADIRDDVFNASDNALRRRRLINSLMRQRIIKGVKHRVVTQTPFIFSFKLAVKKALESN